MGTKLWLIIPEYLVDTVSNLDKVSHFREKNGQYLLPEMKVKLLSKIRILENLYLLLWTWQLPNIYKLFW